MPKNIKSPLSTEFTLTLEPQDNERLANLSGPLDEHLREVERRLGLQIANRGNLFQLSGPPDAVRDGARVLRSMYMATEKEVLSGPSVHLLIKEMSGYDAAGSADGSTQEVVIRTKRGVVRGRGANQARYLHAIATLD